MTEPQLPPRSRPATGMLEHLREQLAERITAEGVAGAGPTGPRVLGYRVRCRRGEGAMGEVWAAEDATGHPVALKIMKPAVALDAHGQRRFMREARALAELCHPGIVKIHDVGLTEDERPFLAMELLEGPTLAEHIDSHAPLPWARARMILVQLAEALVAAHARGVVHRDLKPSNIMLVGDDEEPRCKLIDFGLARHDPSQHDASSYTMTGQLLGTPAYMSPEQLRGEQTDERSDVYALGCIAYELFTGQRPFGQGTPEEMFYRHLGLPAPHPTGVLAPHSYRPAVEAILLRSLRKRPANRFQSMDELATALGQVDTAHDPVDVPDETLWNTSAPSSSSTSRVLVLAGATALGLGGWALGRSTTEEPAASQPRPPLDPAATEPIPEAQPSTAPSTNPAIEVTAGIAFVCARTSAGAIRCWGSDSRGRLGRGTHGSNIGDNEYPREAAVLDTPPGRAIAQLTSGADARHVCVRFVDGGLRCWGYNSRGQLGRGTTEIYGDDPDETVTMAGDLSLGPVVDVVLGLATTCAIDQSGRAVCWGEGTDGLRGDGRTEAIGDDEPLDERSLRPVALGPRAVTALALGRHHGCALLDDGTVRCWGSNARGQLGVPGWSHAIGDGVGDGQGRGQRPDDPTLAVQDLGDVQVIDIAAAGDRSCVLTATGRVRCWGDNTNGQLGYDPALLPDCDPAASCVVEAPLGDLDLGDSRVVELSLSRAHACVRDEHGVVACWGSHIWGRLGDGLSRSLPTAALGIPSVAMAAKPVALGDFDGDGHPDPVVQISLGDEHGCARMADGGLRCWGHGTAGRLGYASSDTVGDNETPAEYYERIGIAAVPVF